VCLEAEEDLDPLNLDPVSPAKPATGVLLEEVASPARSRLAEFSSPQPSAPEHQGPAALDSKLETPPRGRRRRKERRQVEESSNPSTPQPISPQTSRAAGAGELTERAGVGTGRRSGKSREDQDSATEVSSTTRRGGSTKSSRSGTGAELLALALASGNKESAFFLVENGVDVLGDIRNQAQIEEAGGKAFSAELAAMATMGMKDKTKNLTALLRSKGDLTKAIVAVSRC